MVPSTGHETELAFLNAKVVFSKNMSVSSTLLLGSNLSAFLKVWMASVYSPCKANTFSENARLLMKSTKD